jgi:hypothetical protein
MKRIILLAGAVALAVSFTAAFAQDGGKAKPRTAASLECSKQADAKGLHGKARQKFRNKCKRDAAKAGK